MFVSTGNNFGAGEIRFKSYQAENYVVLNANFVVSTASAAYQAAEVLEIYVPALSIDRSVEVGVYVAIRDRRQSYGAARFYDGGYLARSWIKDANTICIEKLACMNGFSTLYFYIAALYPQLNQGLSAEKQTKVTLTLTPVEACCGTKDNAFFVVFEHWVAVYLGLGYASSEYERFPWEGIIPGFPTDVQAVLPLFGGQNQYNSQFSGYSEGRIKDGHFASPYRAESNGAPFAYAFLVRGDNAGEQMDLWPMASAAERMRWVFEQERQGTSILPADFAFEVGHGLVVASLMGWMECPGAGYSNRFVISELERNIPAGRTGFVVRARTGSGLVIYDVFCDLYRGTGSASFSLSCSSGANDVLDLFDTGVYTYNQY